MKSLKPGYLLVAVIVLIGLTWLIMGGNDANSPQTLSSQETIGSGTSQINYTTYIIRITIITILLVGAIVVMGYWYKRNLNPQKHQGLSVEILGKAYLGTRQQLALVKVLNSYLLMGITDQAINIIREYDSGDIPDRLQHQEALGGVAFADWLNKLTHRGQSN